MTSRKDYALTRHYYLLKNTTSNAQDGEACRRSVLEGFQNTQEKSQNPQKVTWADVVKGGVAGSPQKA